MANTTNRNYPKPSASAENVEILGDALDQIDADILTALTDISTDAQAALDGKASLAAANTFAAAGNKFQTATGLNSLTVETLSDHHAGLVLKNSVFSGWNMAVNPTTGDYSITELGVANQMHIKRGGAMSIGVGAAPTLSGSGKLHIGGDTLRINSSRTPASSAATGNHGELCADDTYLYRYCSTQWKRVAWTTF